MAKIKKYKLRTINESYQAFEIIGVITGAPLVKFIFDLNNSLPIKFALNKKHINFKTSKLSFEVPIYISVENKKEDPRVYVFENQVNIEEKKPEDLFVTEKILPVYPAYKQFNFFVFIPSEHFCSFKKLKNYFKVPYYTYFEPVNMYDLKPFPIFPEHDLFT